eukprot:6222-Heterococcus_DN1.PRE.4
MALPPSSSAYATLLDGFSRSIGHKGQFGHERLEFQLRFDGKLRYINQSNYKGGALIQKEMHVSPLVLEEVKNIITKSGILDVSDEKWPEPNKDGSQTLEIKLGSDHICFTCSKLGSALQVQTSNDPDSLVVFYYLTQDLKCFIMNLVNMHFKIKPLPM